MKRSNHWIDFVLVTLSVTTIMLSLLPLSRRQQSPVDALSRKTSVETQSTDQGVTGERVTGEPELPQIDVKVAVTRWQEEAEAFYAQRDRAHGNRAQPVESFVRPAGFTASATGNARQVEPTESGQGRRDGEPMALASGPLRTDEGRGRPEASAIGSVRSESRGPVSFRAESRTPLSFCFAIFAGVLLGLGYLEWSRQTPVQVPATIEFCCEQESAPTVDLQPHWVTVSQRSAVKLRRATLCGLVAGALSTLVL